MKRSVLFSVFMFLGLLWAFGTTWVVGPTRTYTMPSQVSTLVQNGDTVVIDSSIYNSDVAIWNASNLLIKGTGGFAHLQANGQSYGGKAIWVINGNNTEVDSVEFSLCSCPSFNGAGIRQQGTGLIVRHCYFHDNEEGILTTSDSLCDILIEYTEFYNNGHGDGYSHNLYINHVRSLTFQYNYTHHANVGHELKSRAWNNYILYNRFSDDSDGTASRAMDLPNGGVAVIIGNEIEKGPQAQNANVMEFGLEGLTNPGPHQLFLINNTFVNNRSSCSFVDIQTHADLYKGYNNIFAGPGTLLISDSTVIDTANNLVSTIAGAGLTDPTIEDYHLLPASAAINAGTNPGFAGGFSLTPVYEYVHPVSTAARNVVGILDVGAHEFGVATVIENICRAVFSIFPNPSNGNFTIDLSGLPAAKSEIELLDGTGRLVSRKEIDNCSGKIVFFEDGLSNGLYFLRIVNADYSGTQKLLIHHQ